MDLTPGLSLRVNESGFTILRVHYLAHPEKRTVKWRVLAKQGLTDEQWKAEYEIDWGSNEGALVYATFDASLHLARTGGDELASSELVGSVHQLANSPTHQLTSLPYQKQKPVVVGLDITGLNPAAVAGQVANGWGTWHVLGELCAVGMSVDVFARELKEYLFTRFPDGRFIFFSDPAAWSRRDTDASTPVRKFVECVGEVSVLRGATDYASRHEAVNRRLTARPEHGGLQIDRLNCPILCEAFESGYRYSDKQLTVGTTLQPKKDKFSHPMDALQYLLTGYDRYGVQGARLLTDEEILEADALRKQEEEQSQRRRSVAGYG